ncbi:hypothetical protein DFH27DRAFT_554881 [Peziza echinospora]|nr:hypothetical protein DFH27DRAFT_554881 [Peziza echinospora]
MKMKMKMMVAAGNGGESATTTTTVKQKRPATEQLVKEPAGGKRVKLQNNNPNPNPNLISNNGSNGVPAAAVLNSPSNITFVRSRMFYSRPTLTAGGNVATGLRHIHILNQTRTKPPKPITTTTTNKNKSKNPNPASHEFSETEQTQRILQYIFPRQFGLHNVFTSAVDKIETSHRFKDYTTREDEIQRKTRRGREGGVYSYRPLKVPRRLAGERVRSLVEGLRRGNEKCGYWALVRYYCPSWLCDEGAKDPRLRLPGPEKALFSSSCVSEGIATQAYNLPSGSSSARPARTTAAQIPTQKPTTTTSTKTTTTKTTNPPDPAPPTNSIEQLISKPVKQSFTDHATSVGEVSAFVAAVIRTVIPREFFGGEENRRTIMRSVERFVRLRRFETLSLHDVLQGLKVCFNPTHISRISISEKKCILLLTFNFFYLYNTAEGLCLARASQQQQLEKYPHPPPPSL